MSTRKLSLTTFVMAVVVVGLLLGAFGVIIGRAQTAKPRLTLVPTLTVPPDVATATLSPSASASISGRVWHDLCAEAVEEGGTPLSPSAGCVPAAAGGYQADGMLETGEPGIGGVTVQLGGGDCPATGLATAVTGLDGSYSFANLTPGTYCVSVDAAQPANALLLPGGWTAPAANVRDSRAVNTVTVQQGEARSGVNFGWDYQFLPIPGPSSTATPNPTEPGQPTATSTPVPTPIVVGCTDQAAFVSDVTIPDNTNLLPGQSFVKTWRLRNTGTCTWDSTYALVFVGGDQMGGAFSVPLGRSVAPGQTVDLSVTLTAPTATGTFQGKWQLRNADGDLFGIGRSADDPFWVKVVVNPPPTAQPATPTPTTPPVPSVNNWRGEYYNNRDLSGVPTVVRDDAEINFDWGTGGPSVNLPVDSFSARWSRTLSFSGGTYRFYALSDDGVRVWLDGELIINQWHDASGTTYTAERSLSTAAHSLRIEYYENGGNAKILVWWERLGDFPQWRGTYFPNTSLSGVAPLVRNDSDINFDWGRAAPAPGLPVDGFSVRWTRSLLFEEGLYRFHAAVDDGVRIYVDDALAVNAWQDGGRREVTGDYRMSPGYHTVRVEYYERGGDASIQVWWERINLITDWRGEYWSNTSLSGNPVVVRNDVSIDFTWGLGSPANNIPADNFSARWTRSIPFEAGTYRFHVLVDDGARLWIDDRLAIDGWRDGAARELTADIPLTAGEHGLKLEYYERSDNARIRLWWEKVSSNAYPDWKGEYWANANLSGKPSMLRNDRSIDFSWGTGAAGAGLPADRFSARWTRQVNLDAGVYLFSAVADDGIRFYLDGALMLDEWHSSTGNKTYSVSVPLVGAHRLVVEYYEGVANALVKFSWKRVGEIPTNTPRPTDTPTPTATPLPPTATPTATPIPPTATPIRPIRTLVPSITPEPPIQSQPTATPVPPTATPVPPTATPVPPTATAIPPTATLVPPTATSVPPTVTPEPVTGVVLNELLAAPLQVDWNRDGVANDQDAWIELYNPGNKNVNLGGWSISAGSGGSYSLPGGSVLKPGAFLVLYQQQTGLVLSGQSTEVRLLDGSGRPADSALLPALGPNASYSRDDGGNWHTDWAPSPGRANRPMKVIPGLGDRLGF
jgi:hypothetical protein